MKQCPRAGHTAVDRLLWHRHPLFTAIPGCGVRCRTRAPRLSGKMSDAGRAVLRSRPNGMSDRVGRRVWPAQAHLDTRCRVHRAHCWTWRDPHLCFVACCAFDGSCRRCDRSYRHQTRGSARPHLLCAGSALPAQSTMTSAATISGSERRGKERSRHSWVRMFTSRPNGSFT